MDFPPIAPTRGGRGLGVLDRLSGSGPSICCQVSNGRLPSPQWSCTRPFELATPGPRPSRCEPGMVQCSGKTLLQQAVGRRDGQAEMLSRAWESKCQQPRTPAMAQRPASLTDRLRQSVRGRPRSRQSGHSRSALHIYSNRRQPPGLGLSQTRPRCETMTVWSPTLATASLEALMGNKDKGGRHTKTAAIKNLKEKRLEKKAKRTAADAKRNRAD